MEFECELRVNGKRQSFQGNAGWKGMELAVQNLVDLMAGELESSKN